MVVLVEEVAEGEAALLALVVVDVVVGVELAHRSGDLELLRDDEVAGLDDEAGVVEVGEVVAAVVLALEELAEERRSP